MSQPIQPMRMGLSAKVTSEIMVAIMIILLVAVILLFLFYIYTKHYYDADLAARSSRIRFIFEHHPAEPAPPRGLDADTILSLPITVFRAETFKDGLECTICLSDLSEGEEARLLPKCSHGFHLDCIDMWFKSHTTCPLCRTPVVASPPPTLLEPEAHVVVDVPETTEPAPTSGGELCEGCSSSGGRKMEGVLVIDIPRRAAAGGFASPSSPLPTSWLAAEETKSPASARMRTSLRRLVGRGVGSVCSPRGCEVELGGGEGSRPAARTPTSSVA